MPAIHVRMVSRSDATPSTRLLQLLVQRLDVRFVVNYRRVMLLGLTVELRSLVLIVVPTLVELGVPLLGLRVPEAALVDERELEDLRHAEEYCNKLPSMHVYGSDEEDGPKSEVRQ